MISKDFLPLFFIPKGVPGASPKRKAARSNRAGDARLSLNAIRVPGSVFYFIRSHRFYGRLSFLQRNPTPVVNMPRTTVFYALLPAPYFATVDTWRLGKIDALLSLFVPNFFVLLGLFLSSLWFVFIIFCKQLSKSCIARYNFCLFSPVCERIFPYHEAGDGSGVH